MQGDPLFLKCCIFIGVLGCIFRYRPQDRNFTVDAHGCVLPSGPGPVAVMGVVDLSRNEILNRRIRNARSHTVFSFRLANRALQQLLLHSSRCMMTRMLLVLNATRRPATQDGRINMRAFTLYNVLSSVLYAARDLGY